MTRRPTPVLFCDMDGTIRLSHRDLGYWPTKIEDMKVFDGVPERLAKYKLAGWRIAGMSNQGGIARGLVRLELCQEMMDQTNRLCGGAFDVIEFCSHHPQAFDFGERECLCRKPAYGMLVKILDRLERLHPEESYPQSLSLVVGDLPEDHMCALDAGIRFIPASAWRSGEVDLI